MQINPRRNAMALQAARSIVTMAANVAWAKQIGGQRYEIAPNGRKWATTATVVHRHKQIVPRGRQSAIAC